ncbi:MAG: hypothetical protein ABS904_00940 [Solibacillus isronensis]
MYKKLKKNKYHKSRDIFNPMVKVFLVLILIITSTSTGILGSKGIDIASKASASGEVVYTLKIKKQVAWAKDYSVDQINIDATILMAVDVTSNTAYIKSVSGTWNVPTENIVTRPSFSKSVVASDFQYIKLDEYGPEITTSKKTFTAGDFSYIKNALNSNSVGQTLPAYAKYNIVIRGTTNDNYNYFPLTVQSYSASTGDSCSGGSTGTAGEIIYNMSVNRQVGWAKDYSVDRVMLNSSMQFSVNPTNNTAYIKSITGTWNIVSENIVSRPSFTKSATVSDFKYITVGDSGPQLTGSPKTYGAYDFAQITNYLNKQMVGQQLGFNTLYSFSARGTNQETYAYLPLTVMSYSEGTSSGSCTPAPSPTPTPAPTPSLTCPSGTTKKGSGSSAYCEKVVTNNVKQTEYQNPDFIKDLDLSELISNMGEFGSSGERGDGQFNLDSGNHNNGWHLNGNGESYKSNHIQFTNIPDNGYVNAIGDSWTPEYLITQGKLKIDIPVSTDSTTVEKQKRDTDLNSFKSTNSLSEVLTYKVTDLEKLKDIQNTTAGLSDLFTKTSSTYKYANDITSHNVGPQGEGDYSKLKVKESGYYIIASKYVDMVSATKEQSNPSQEVITKHTYYSFIPVSVNFMTDLGYLPIYNNLMTQINDSILVVGNKKGNHKLSNLTYKTYKSLKAPSAYNHNKDKTVIGSTSGGLQLLDKELKPITVNDSTGALATTSVMDVVEYNNGFYIATDDGILYLNCETNELTKTDITDAVNDLEINYDTIYYLTDDRLYTSFLTDAGLVHTNKDYDITSMFQSPTTKAGRVEVVGNLITVSSKDDSTNSEVITLSK